MLHFIYFFHCVESLEIFKKVKNKLSACALSKYKIKWIVSVLGLLCAVIVPFLSRMIAIVYCTQLFPTGMAGSNQHLEIRIWLYSDILLI